MGKTVKLDISTADGGAILGTDNRLIDVEVITTDLKSVEKRMKGLEHRAPAALQSGINRSMTEIRKTLLKHIKARYALKDKAAAKKAIRPQRAKLSDLTGRLYISGPPIELREYKYKRGGIQGVPGQRGYSVAVKKETSPVHLTHPKSFWTGVNAETSKHHGIFARVGSDRLPIKKLMGPSVPGVVIPLYEEKQAEYDKILEKYLQIAISKQFAKYGR